VLRQSPQHWESAPRIGHLAIEAPLCRRLTFSSRRWIFAHLY